MADSTKQDFDVVIVGAGISGINTAYRLQEALPDYSYTVLETRNEIGGTWSLFKYPGIRSDSDLFTFGFAWSPWEKENPIADAPSILEYMNRVSKKAGIYDNIRFQNAVQKLEWKSDQQRWFISVEVNGEKQQTLSARFVVMGTGYYDQKRGLAAEIPGIENFKGQIIHPQSWPEEYDYTDKKVIIIGSGATAVTILPAMSERAKHVTMLQRSPGYFISLPTVGQPVENFIRRWMPTSLAHSLIRLKFMVQGWLFIRWCRLQPEKAKKLLKTATEKELPKDVPYDPNFKPKYNPWNQRMCIVPGKVTQGLKHVVVSLTGSRRRFLQGSS
jgi:cation diffusion facilitator CzcD-associated flavoprotein CzcO